MADWSELPSELLHEIVMRLETIEDFVYFSIICRLWNIIASMAKHKFSGKTMPWLLLVENVEENSDYLRKVLNPINNKCYQLKLPETIGCRCWGSANGWLVTYSQDTELHMFNPLTKARMLLPPISYLPYKWGPHFSICYPSLYAPGTLEEVMRLMFIRKAFVFEIAQDDFIVFVIYYHQFKKLAFARPSDQSWTFVEEPVVGVKDSQYPSRDAVSSHVADVVCYGAQILILYDDGSLGYLDICDLSDPQKLVVNKHRPKYPMILSDSGHRGMKATQFLPASPKILQGFEPVEFGLYLVESCGDIFMVLRDRREIMVDADTLDYETFKFMVYQYDFDKENWSQVHHLGDVALFVGDNISMAVRGTAAGNRSNRIYYTDDACQYWDLSCHPAGKDMGVFNLETGKIEDSSIYDGCDRYSRLQPPLWFMPRF